MDVYKSKNSQYVSKDGNIIREHGLEKENWGNLWVYTSIESLDKFAKQKKIKFLQRPKLDEKVAQEFIHALQDEEMDITEVGGRIFALRKCPGEKYIPCWSTKIINISESEINLSQEIDLNK